MKQHPHFISLLQGQLYDWRLWAALGMVAGLSLGREGSSVQIGAGIMYSRRNWLPKRGLVSDHGLLIAGSAAGIAAAFNTPQGGIMSAIEELSRGPEQRSNGLIMAAIVLAGVRPGRVSRPACAGVGCGWQSCAQVWRLFLPLRRQAAVLLRPRAAPPTAPRRGKWW